MVAVGSRGQRMVVPFGDKVEAGRATRSGVGLDWLGDAGGRWIRIGSTVPWHVARSAYAAGMRAQMGRGCVRRRGLE